MTAPLIRRAKSDDVDAIVAMLQAIHAQHLAWDAARWTTREPPHVSYGAWIADLTLRPDDGGVWVAEVDGRITGYALAEVEPESTRHWVPEAVYLHDIFVAEPHRRLGIARSLLATVLAWAKDNRPELQLRLMTAAANERARTFFAAFGFRPCVVELIREAED